MAKDETDILTTIKGELEAMTTAELERGIASGGFDFNRKLEAERILRERYAAPERSLLFWTLVFVVIGTGVTVFALFQ